MADGPEPAFHSRSTSSIGAADEGDPLLIRQGSDVRHAEVKCGWPRRSAERVCLSSLDIQGSRVCSGHNCIQRRRCLRRRIQTPPAASFDSSRISLVVVNSELTLPTSNHKCSKSYRLLREVHHFVIHTLCSPMHELALEKDKQCRTLLEVWMTAVGRTFSPSLKFDNMARIPCWTVWKVM